MNKEKAERAILWRDHPEMGHSKKLLRNFETARSKIFLDIGNNLHLAFLQAFLRKLLEIKFSDFNECRFCGEEEKENPVPLAIKFPTREGTTLIERLVEATSLCSTVCDR